MLSNVTTKTILNKRETSHMHVSSILLLSIFNKEQHIDLHTYFWNMLEIVFIKITLRRYETRGYTEAQLKCDYTFQTYLDHDLVH